MRDEPSNFRATTPGNSDVEEANPLFMDGRVDLGQNSTDVRAWSAQGTRSGGKVVHLSL